MSCLGPGEVAARPLASQWSDEKSASVDWADPEDILGNELTFLQVLLLHPKLADHMRCHTGEKEEARDLFARLAGARRAADAATARAALVQLLRDWWTRQLLTPRDARWCRCCGCAGHTRRVCPQRLPPRPIPADAAASILGPGAETGAAAQTARPPSSIREKLRAHQQHIERLRLLHERRRRGAGTAGDAGPRRTRGPRREHGSPSSPATAAEGDLFADERRRGSIARVDAAFNIGFIRAPELGEVKFFINNADYGVKTMAVGDAVLFKVDTSRSYPIAIDVRPEKSTVSAEEAEQFVRRCSIASRPMEIITMLLTHPHEWHEVLRHVWAARTTAAPASAGGLGFAASVHAFIELTTFVGNREPIHLTMLQAFLVLTTTAAADDPRQGAGTPAVALYPDMVHAALAAELPTARALAQAGTDEAARRLLYLSDQWIEVANYVVLLRQHARVAASVARTTAEVLFGFFAERLASTPPVRNQRQLEAAVRRLRLATEEAGGGAAGGLAILPTAAELSVPPGLPDSVFTPANLPVNAGVTYTTTEAFIAAHRALLRADTFEATARVLPAACYKLPGYTPSAETAADVEHACVFGQVRFRGRVVTRDCDFARPVSAILQLEPASAKANLSAKLRPGTTVVISTAPDPAVMSDGDLFWGVISSCDAQLLAAGMVVVAAVEGGAPLSKLEENLRRNEAAGAAARSVLMETPIFMAGYASIMQALGAFTGPMPMPLPMADIIVSAAAAAAQSGEATSPALSTGAAAAMTTTRTAPVRGDSGGLLAYIPPHCEHAFLELTKDVRARYALDAGQDAVMRRLPRSKVLLVQGPPGTGKSFIGCRVVETYVRYKQLVASGDILQRIRVDALPDLADGGQLLPTVGPVVVITYKNHALDEFLVDLLETGLWDGAGPRVRQALVGSSGQAGFGGAAATATGPSPLDVFPRGRRLVRIGGRSREGRLDGYNLAAMMHTAAATPTIKSLKERVYVLTRRLEKLVEQVHHLEHGRVPRSHFERWLTSDQRQSMQFDDKDAWLRGERYVGTSTRTGVDPQLYLRMLRTEASAALQGASTRSASAGAARAAAVAAAADGDEEDVSLSVFQEMRREDESREFNDSLHREYLSAEAIHLAAHPPVRPACVPAELLSLWSLDPVGRHEYYAYLIRQAIAVRAKSCLLLMDTIASVVRIRNHAMDEAKLTLLRGADVIGLTTTGCAMHQNLLRSLRPSVLVVEEAAEVLESQLLACMTDSLEQVVLIGDHFQLQPKVDTFLYERINHLNLSLFERLARGMRPIRLTDQRRMHPAISQLVRPFYNDQPLMDHPSVRTRPFISATGQAYPDSVPGLARRVFFWRHDHPEEEAPGSRSKVNMRETLMVKQIAQHLVAEGVAQASITVITPYLGQCRMLRSIMRMSSLADVRVSTVDLFQGDENDIIILSMTRTGKLTEFIRMRNRLIVSCSRARFAMVFVGNDALLRQCSHWEQVLQHLDKDGCVGDALPITHGERPGVVTELQVRGSISAASIAKQIDPSAHAGPVRSRVKAETALTAGGEDAEVPSEEEGGADDGGGGGGGPYATGDEEEEEGVEAGGDGEE